MLPGLLARTDEASVEKLRLSKFPLCRWDHGAFSRASESNPQDGHRSQLQALSSLRPNPHSAAQLLNPISRGFLLWRLSDDGPSAKPHRQNGGRHPKPFTNSNVPFTPRKSGSTGCRHGRLQWPPFIKLRAIEQRSRPIVLDCF